MITRLVFVLTVAAAAAGILGSSAPQGEAVQQPAADPAQEQATPERRALFRRMVWGSSEERDEAAASWRRMSPPGQGRQRDSRDDFFELEEALRQGPLQHSAGAEIDATSPGTEIAPASFAAELPDGGEIPVFVQVPPGHAENRPWPVVFAMHGGPPGSAEGAIRGAARMIDVWREPAAEAGWIVVSPAMTHVRSMGPRTENRLPYEILRPEQARAVLSEVQRRHWIDPDRIVSTGISLGSNFSIGFAAAMPDRFAAIVPVSTEGDSREHLLRNLQHVPAYVLEGTQDRNIRGISGPRALGNILARFAYDVTYREFGDRAHEGFQELYPDVLRWLSSRPRDAYPREVLRVPHDGIMPPSRRVFWVETDTRQGLVQARVTADNHIELTTRWVRSVQLYLHDRLVDLDRPIELTVNGVRLGTRDADRSVVFGIEQVRELDDPGRPAGAKVIVDVPVGAAAADAGNRLWEMLRPVHPEGELSFWEFYAVNALVERLPELGLQGSEIELAAELRSRLTAGGFASGNEIVGIEIESVDPDGAFAGSGVRTGDILLEIGGEPFFRGRGDLESLHHWLLRELTAVPRDFELVVWRDSAVVRLAASLALGPYRDQ